MAHLPFFEDAAQGLQPQVLAAVALDRNMLDLQWAGDEFSVGDGDDIVWVHQGDTAIMAASSGGHAGLVKELALLGANVHALNEVDALMLASRHGRVAVCSVLLDHGAVMTTKYVNGWTALHWSAVNAHLQVCLLLCSKGADLMAVDQIGDTALQGYGSNADPPLSHETEEEHKAALLDCFRKGPHPSQVQRRKDENWARRLPLMLVMTGCDFRPLIARQLALLLLSPALPPDAAIPPIEIATVAQKRAFLNMAVFGHEGLGETHRELPVSIVVFVTDATASQSNRIKSNQIESVYLCRYDLHGREGGQ